MVRVAVIVFSGSNREIDVMRAVELSGGEGVSLELVSSGKTDLPLGCDMVILPGGFSYGDYLRGGAIARVSPIMSAIMRFAAGGGMVVGICNGFQILTECGLLEGGLVRNSGGYFICRYLRLVVNVSSNILLSSYSQDQRVYWPVAHTSGRFVADEYTLDKLEGEGRVALRYDEGQNVNGSMRNIAGITNEGGNVLGFMPHPENAVRENRPPDFEGKLEEYRAGEKISRGDGRQFFETIKSKEFANWSF